MQPASSTQLEELENVGSVANTVHTDAIRKKRSPKRDAPAFQKPSDTVVSRHSLEPKRMHQKRDVQAESSAKPQKSDALSLLEMRCRRLERQMAQEALLKVAASTEDTSSVGHMVDDADMSSELLVRSWPPPLPEFPGKFHQADMDRAGRVGSTSNAASHLHVASVQGEIACADNESLQSAPPSPVLGGSLKLAPGPARSQNIDPGQSDGPS
jgi:hypothetical protein